jgi:hypothetical protein
MRKIVERKSEHDDIETRVSDFIAKLDAIGDNSSKISSCVRNELRWLGAEGDKPRYAIGTIRSYLFKYKDAVSTKLPFNKGAIRSIENLSKKHKGKLDSILPIEGTPGDVINKIKVIMSEMTDKTDGLYDDLSKLKVAHNAYYLLHVKKGQAALLKDVYKKTTAARKRNKIKISKQAVIEAVKGGLSSKQKYKTLIALSLCCGRRPVELYKTALFDYKNKGECIFSGQVKKKYGQVAESYTVPILHISSKEFLKAFKAFREMIGDMSELSHTQVSSKITSDISDTARKMLLNDNANLYLCRSIYANWAAENQPDKDRDIVMADILGHEKDDVMTVNSYQDVQLVDTTIEDAEEHYKASLQKDRKRVAATGRQQVESKAHTKTQLKDAERLSKRLEKLQPQADAEGRAVGNINQWAIEYLKDSPDAEFTQTMITKAKGSSRPAIKKWLDLTSDIRI